MLQENNDLQKGSVPSADAAVLHSLNTSQGGAAQSHNAALPSIPLPQAPYEVLGVILETGCRVRREEPLEIPALKGELEILRIGRSLRFIDPSVRLPVLKQIVGAMVAREDVGDVGLSTLPHLLRFCPPGERAEVVKCALTHSEGNHRLVTKLVVNVLRCSPNLDQLVGVVQGVGVEQLEKLGSRAVREFIAWATLGPALRAIKLPSGVSNRLDLDRANQRINELREVLASCIEVTQADPKIRGTEVARRFRKIAKEDLEYLGRQMKAFKATERLASRRTLKGSPEAAIRRRRGLAGLMVEMMKVEFTFGINLTSERNKLGRNVRVWKAEEVRKIHTLLSKAIPEGTTLFTPHLKEFRRVAGKDKRGASLDYNGLRDRDGQIHVTDDGIKDDEFAKQFGMRSPLLPLLAHEQGHSLHIGQGRSAKNKICSRRGHILGPFDPLYNPQAFNELSTWRAYEPSRFKIIHHGQGVIIDGQTHAIDTPTIFRGQLVVFQHDAAEKLLFSYAADALFSTRAYSRCTPWEDAAESFAEYVLMPERLASFAPAKFFFWELHFGKYEEKGWLYELASQKLAFHRLGKG